MFERWRKSGGEVAVLGLAKSGVAATLVLRQAGFQVYASDKASDPATEARAESLRAAGATVELGDHDLPRIGRATAVVVSPGVPPEVPALVAARRAGIEIVSELDVGAEAVQGARYAVITGTNGKTTTTALVGHLLTTAGITSLTAGNIGRPLCQVALDGEHPSWIALEISSFQLHDTHYLVPDIGLLTNLAPDHLDRYPTLEGYYADKRLLFRHATLSSTWIVNGDDDAAVRMAEGVEGRQLRFSVRDRADAWFDRSTSMLMLGDVTVVSRKDLSLLGDHNIANALAAVLVAEAAGAPLDGLRKGLVSFRALAHRLEPVREVGGVLWINDSKATNVASTTVAVAALDRPFVLLLGGRHKGEPYTGLLEPMGDRCRGVVAFGEARPLVVHDLAGRVPVTEAVTFGEVLSAARALARPGDAVLLSPACSSYDMFKNYEDRGAQFRAAVEAM
ncbi:MAG: UDP-N-acetylmuramoyl-L-alanine--D-glutamate ligase [Gemmatimonadota bacterium]